MRKLFKNASADIPASVVVFLVALPLCLGIALGSGAPLFSGIIAGMAEGIVIGLLSGPSLSINIQVEIKKSRFKAGHDLVYDQLTIANYKGTSIH